jgi:DNA polymerase IV
LWAVEPIRKIIHIDMDAFYASVEQRDFPELRGKPVVVGGPPDSRGVVAACSYEARKFKIRSAMSSSKAARLCPQAIFVPPRFSVYKEVSQKMMAILREASDTIEPLSLDEAYLDVTQNKLQEPSATKIAMYLKARIRGQLSLTASAGVATNKFLAKLASDMRKPDGLMVIPPERVEEIVRDLDIEKLWGIGPATARKLRARGWNTTADLRRLSRESLTAVLGSFGGFIHGLARGEDSRLVCASREMKSRGAETTFERDLLDLEKLENKLKELSERVARDLIKKNTSARQVCLKVKYSDFSTVTRSKTLPERTDSGDRIFDTARQLLRAATEAGQRPVRLIGVSVSGFTAGEQAAESDQLSLPIN